MSTEKEKIAQGICVSPNRVDHCPYCVDVCEAAQVSLARLKKPENAAHGYSEGAELPQVTISGGYEPEKTSQKALILALFKEELFSKKHIGTQTTARSLGVLEKVLDELGVK